MKHATARPCRHLHLVKPMPVWAPRPGELVQVAGLVGLVRAADSEHVSIEVVASPAMVQPHNPLVAS